MSGTDTSFTFEQAIYENTPLSVEFLGVIGKDLASLVKRWQTDYEKIEGQKLAESSIKDLVLDVIATIEERCKGIKQITSERITKYLHSIQSEKKLIYASELREKFSDDEIRLLTWDCPEGWSYSAPSSSQMTDYNFVDKTFDKMIRMANGCIAYYFYFQPGFNSR